MLKKFWEVRRKQNYKWFLPVSTRQTSSNLFIGFEFSTRYCILWSLVMCSSHFDFSPLAGESECQDSPFFRSHFRNVTRSVYMRQRKESAVLILSRNLPWSFFHFDLAFLKLSWEPSYLTWFFPRAHLQVVLLIMVLELTMLLLPRVDDRIMWTWVFPPLEGRAILSKSW